MKNSYFLFFLLLCFSSKFQAQHVGCQSLKKLVPLSGGSMLDDPGNVRSDTLDVLGYDITLDMTLMNSSQISGACAVHFKSLMNSIDWINLDLQSLLVDSVRSSGVHLAFSHVGELLNIQLLSELNVNDEATITVYYHGSPGQDATWGGFYFQSGYAYNLGVAFTAEPHTFGRAWFPCFDNFVERSSYTFHVLTNQNRTAYCNGIKTGTDAVGQDSLLTHWQLDELIPSYLASVTVTNYVQAESSFSSISGNEIPIWLVARALDTTDMKQSMIHLQEWMEEVEVRYGPYRWPRVGYCAVPFSAGAMEHATNISYPVFACDGTLTYETLYAHEVAHHWWGDLVTCRNADEMWLNEGWASYSESLFKELIYGIESYKENVRTNHKDVLLFAHKRDGGRYPVRGIPSELTYGDHVYNKGADMAHTLRGYMGDADFFDGINAFMDAKQYSDISSEDLRDFMQDYTDADLTSFFDNWIFEAGFPEFRVQNFVNVLGSQWQVFIEQHKHYAPNHYLNVPVQLTALNAEGIRFYSSVLLSGEMSEPIVTLPDGFIPVAFFLNEDEAISQAVLAENQVIYANGSHDFDFAEMDMDLLDIGMADSVMVRVENHWAAVNEEQIQEEYYISPDRWWSVYHNGELAGVDLKASIRYYGNDGQSNYFDPEFFEYLESQGLNEDSLILLYRENGISLWHEWIDFDVVTTPGLTNWTGRIDINHLLPGDYAWAVRTGIVGVSESSVPSVSIYQSGESIVINAGHQFGECIINDVSGKEVWHRQVIGSEIIPTGKWSSGIYFVKWNSSLSNETFLRKIVVH